MAGETLGQAQTAEEVQLRARELFVNALKDHQKSYPLALRSLATRCALLEKYKNACDKFLGFRNGDCP